MSTINPKDASELETYPVTEEKTEFPLVVFRSGNKVGRFFRVQVCMGIFEIPMSDEALPVAKALVKRAVATGCLPDGGEDDLWAEVLTCMGWTQCPFTALQNLGPDWMFHAWGEPGNYKVSLYGPGAGGLPGAKLEPSVFKGCVERMMSFLKGMGYEKAEIVEISELENRAEILIPEERSYMLVKHLLKAFKSLGL
jgi:hypothetical protein